VAAGAAAVALAVTILVITMSGGGASWPASVAAIQRQAAIACQNPDVKAEPSQINFACAKPTRQILWVFALLTSGGNAGFRDATTGRVGLEPITPAQGGQVAWSLNLHHPYDPANPVDSLQVAARAINNIIGGATLTGSHGNPVVQPGLESHPGKCEKYTGSPAVISRQGFPDLCASPVTARAGRPPWWPTCSAAGSWVPRRSRRSRPRCCSPTPGIPATPGCRRSSSSFAPPGRRRSQAPIHTGAGAGKLRRHQPKVRSCHPSASPRGSR
jgi:hypothetical protein